MRLRPIEHLENCRSKCKMHTKERQLTRFFCILQLIYKENWTDDFSKPNLTRGFSQNRTELEKSIPHVPNSDEHFRTYVCMYVCNNSRPYARPVHRALHHGKAAMARLKFAMGDPFLLVGCTVIVWGCALHGWWEGEWLDWYVVWG